jgi:hypothetical protein
VEIEWDNREERHRLLAVLRHSLFQLADHKSEKLRELSWLAPKMKNLDMELKKFLSTLVFEFSVNNISLLALSVL